jgi:hypothetical protein
MVMQCKASHLNNNVNCFQLQDGSHATHIHLIYEHNNQDVILDLQLNDNLIPIEHFISYQLPNGDKAIKNFTKTDINLCNYQVSELQLNPHELLENFEILSGENSK